MVPVAVPANYGSDRGKGPQGGATVRGSGGGGTTAWACNSSSWRSDRARRGKPEARARTPSSTTRNLSSGDTGGSRAGGGGAGASTGAEAGLHPARVSGRARAGDQRVARTSGASQAATTRTSTGTGPAPRQA